MLYKLVSFVLQIKLYQLSWKCIIQAWMKEIHEYWYLLCNFQNNYAGKKRGVGGGGGMSKHSSSSKHKQRTPEKKGHSSSSKNHSSSSKSHGSSKDRGHGSSSKHSSSPKKHGHKDSHRDKHSSSRHSSRLVVISLGSWVKNRTTSKYLVIYKITQKNVLSREFSACGTLLDSRRRMLVLHINLLLFNVFLVYFN